MSRYKAYPAYKDSGVEWLGDIPANWEAKRLGHFFEERREKVSDEDYPPLSVTMQGIVPQLETAAKTDAGDNRKLVLKDDFVINSRSDRKGSSGVSSCDGSVSLISIVMIPRGIHPPFAHHLLRSYPFQEEFYRYGKGIVADLWSTNVSEMKNILVPDAPISEQEKIADFLDHETVKIDTLIEKQQRLIELLKEKRQAVISHAVTKGLNPKAPMKDSGVEWLGEVPAHWSATQLKYATSMIVDCPHETPVYSEEGQYLVIRTADLDEGRLDSSKMYRVDADEYLLRIRRASLCQGDIVYGREGERWGHAGLVPEDHRYCLGQRMMQFRANSLFCPDFLMWLLNSDNIYKQGQVDTVGATSPHVNVGTIRNFSLTQPPLSEQQAISQFLNDKTCRLDALIDKALNTISLLQERRTALISAAVTGKIDVRDWQPAAAQKALGIEC